MSISTPLYERLLLTEERTTQETAHSSAQKRIKIAQPIDMIEDTYAFEFSGIHK